MKAAVYARYGSPEVIELREIAKPVPKDDEVLIRVRAAAANPLDWHSMRGKPYVMRMMGGGLRAPKAPRQLGIDVAGEVEATGAKVTRFKAGDAVFGDVFGTSGGAFAEYACAPEAKLAAKPDNVTFEEAAAAPVAAFTALQGLRDKGHVQAGQSVLIHGAAGGVGTFAVQIAKWLGANVTGVCSTSNVEMVESLGADRVIDYAREDFTAGGPRYDVILDVVGNHSLGSMKRALRPDGMCVVITGPNGQWLGPLARFVGALALSPLGSRKFVPFVTKPNPEDLATLRDLMKAGTVRAVIDRRYGLSEIAEAIRHLETGHARGKIVISVQ